jgi:hypothetical protein
LDKTHEIDIKLVSGPAQAQTATVPIEPEYQEALIEQLRKSETTLIPSCCHDALAIRARKERLALLPLLRRSDPALISALPIDLRQHRLQLRCASRPRR